MCTRFMGGRLRVTIFLLFVVFVCGVAHIFVDCATYVYRKKDVRMDMPQIRVSYYVRVCMVFSMFADNRNKWLRGFFCDLLFFFFLVAATCFWVFGRILEAKVIY